MYKCLKCNKTFTKMGYLEQHMLKNNLPCDLVCCQCGIKQQSKKAFKHHFPKNCQGNFKVSNNGSIENINFSLEFKNPDLTYVKAFGILPHEIEQFEIFEKYMPNFHDIILKYLRKSLQSNQQTIKQLTNYKSLIVSIVSFIYSNPLLPQYVNIIDINPIDEYYRLFNGSTFVQDIMPKNMRNKRILQLLLKILSTLLQSKNIHPEVGRFISECLIRDIICAYRDKTYDEDLQSIWQQNNKNIKDINHLITIPNYAFNDALNFTKQLNDYMNEDSILHNRLMLIDRETCLKIKSEYEQIPFHNIISYLI